MSIPAPFKRSAHLALALGVAVAALAGCSKDTLPVTAATKGLPRLFISDVRYRVRGESHAAGGVISDLSTLIDTMRQWKDFGTLITPLYIVTVDPEILIQTTSHRTVPPEELVDEVAFSGTGATATQKVLRNPLFYLDYAEVKYNVEGYTDLPVRRYNLNLAMKQDHAIIDRLYVSNADQVVRALWDKPDSTPPAMGTCDITIYGRDMDPLLANDQRAINVTRTFPVRYTYGSALLGESVQNKTPLTVPQPAIFGTPAPAAAPAAP